MDLNFLLEKCLIFDIETYAEYPDGREISIQTNFEDYIAYARVRFVGCYSYKHNRAFYFDAIKSFDKIKELIAEHNFLIGYNSEEFDYPIMINNGFIDQAQRFTQVDCMKILCANSFKDKKGFKYKGRGDLMGYKFKKNSLECVAETMGLEFQKSKIDYKIFKKEVYTAEENKEILHYLQNDLMATKGMFDRLWDYWKPFISMLPYDSIVDLSWIRSSIASLIYKSACNVLNTEPTYAEHINDYADETEEMGGRVIKPRYEEAKKVWYIDFTSLYPHIFCMFNLFSEVDKDFPIEKFHGNDLFEVKGYYDITHQHPLSKEVQKRLRERVELKKTDPKNPNIYTLKIWLNGLYGVIRSAIFEKVHKPNAGWDCCWLGQQIQKYTEKRMAEFGFESIYGDTDSLMVVAEHEGANSEIYVKNCLKKIVEEILANVPFPVNTYGIDLENYLDYILFAFSEQPIVDEVTGKNKKEGNRLITERVGNKKNYLYLYTKNDVTDIKLVGLPIIKDNATPLGMKIYKEILKPTILNQKHAKFPKEFIDGVINDYLKQDGILDLLAVEYKVKPFKTYKKESQIHAQVSKVYFGGGDGVAHLIKNHKIGEVGIGTKYCTVEEARQNNLTIEDLDLEKCYNELEPFIIYVPKAKVIKEKKIKKVKEIV